MPGGPRPRGAGNDWQSRATAAREKTASRQPRTTRRRDAIGDPPTTPQPPPRCYVRSSKSPLTPDRLPPPDPPTPHPQTKPQGRASPARRRDTAIAGCRRGRSATQGRVSMPQPSPPHPQFRLFALPQRSGHGRGRDTAPSSSVHQRQGVSGNRTPREAAEQGRRAGVVARPRGRSSLARPRVGTRMTSQCGRAVAAKVVNYFMSTVFHGVKKTESLTKWYIKYFDVRVA